MGRQGGNTGLSDETSSGQVEPLHKAEMVLDTEGQGGGGTDFAHHQDLLGHWWLEQR